MAAIVCVTPAKIVGEATTNLPRCLLPICQFFTAPSPALNAPSTPGSRGTDSSNKLEKGFASIKDPSTLAPCPALGWSLAQCGDHVAVSPCKAHLGLRC